MKDRSKPIVLELLPEVGEAYGIFLQRARIQPREECNNGSPILGAGVALSRDLAQAKAISEIIERYTLDPRLSFMRVRNDFPIHIQWDTQEFILSERDVGFRIPSLHRTLASACHLTREDALQAAMAEAIERKHLVQWCRTCHKTSEVFLAELNLHAEFIPVALRQFLFPRRIRFLFSWCNSSRTLPALVCLALNSARDSFYATSSASSSTSEAIEKVLLDCAKIFLMEDLSLERGHPVRYDYPVTLLPSSFRKKMISKLPPLTIGGHEPDERKSCDVGYCGFLHIAPWTTALGRYVISIADQSPELTPNLFRCFQ